MAGTGVVSCPLCGMRVLPGSDQLCPSCRAYDFGRSALVPGVDGTRVRQRVEEAAKPSPSVHPLSLVSVGLALVALLFGPYPAIVAGLLGGAAGVIASREITRGRGTDLGLWLSRAGAVLGLGMAGGWLAVLIYGRYVTK
jgi:hypothetical protein